MRTWFALLGVVCLLLPATAVRAADDAAAIIDKAIKAQGGAEKLAKYKAEQWSAKGVAHVMGGKFDYTSSYSFQQPDLFRFDMEFEAGGMKIMITAVTDGKNVWEKAMGMVREAEKKKAEMFRHNVYTMRLSQLLPLKEKGFTLSVSGEEKVNNKPAVGILVSSKGHPDVTMFFDKESGLLVKMLTDIWDEFTDKTVSQELLMLEYKEIEGRKLLTKFQIKREGKIFVEEELSGQKSGEKLDPKLFEKPSKE